MTEPIPARVPRSAAEPTLYDHILTAFDAEMDADDYSPSAAAHVAYAAVLPLVAQQDIELREAHAEIERLKNQLNPPGIWTQTPDGRWVPAEPVKPSVGLRISAWLHRRLGVRL